MKISEFIRNNEVNKVKSKIKKYKDFIEVLENNSYWIEIIKLNTYRYKFKLQHPAWFTIKSACDNIINNYYRFNCFSIFIEDQDIVYFEFIKACADVKKCNGDVDKLFELVTECLNERIKELETVYNIEKE